MSEDNNKKFIEFLKKVLLKLKPRFSFHYVAYTIMTILVVFSVIQIAKATTPNPGHPWAQIGDGVFAVTNNQTALRTYTFPNADATVLTTNAPVTLAQGGTGSALADPNADSFMFWDDSEGVTTWIASNSFVTDETDPHALLLDQATPQTIINGAPTFSANLYSPKILGGTGTTDDLTFQTTSGVGTTGADMHFKVGSNGGTEAMTILNSGKIGIINTNPLAKLQINSGTPSSTPNAGYFDMYVGAGDVEFDGAVHFDSAVYFTGSDLALGPVYLSSEGNDLKYAGDLNTVFARNSYRHSYFDHPASSNPFVYINSGTDPDVSNNQWGGMTHDTNNFIISTGINTGVGTAPTTIENAITFAPRGIEAVRISGDGSVGIGTTSPTATLHLKAGTATENTAPLKFTAGTNLTTPEAGAMEWDGTNLFITQTSGPTRKTLAYTSDLASYVPYTGATGNVNLGTYSLISPTILGGSATTADLTLQTTSGVGTTGADMHFKVGSNGGTEAMTILNSGNVGIGTNSPTAKLTVDGAVTPTGAELVTNGTFTGGTTGWTLGDCAAYGTNNVTVTYTACTNAQISTTFAVVSGTTYKVTFNLSGVSGDGVYFNFTNNKYESPNFDNGINSVTFTSSYTGTETIYIKNTYRNANSFWTIDNVSIQEINNTNSFEVVDNSGGKLFTIGGSNGIFAFGNNAGVIDSSAIHSYFLGASAGQNATSTKYSNFFGKEAGADAVNAEYSNFIGYEAGQSAIDATESIFLGPWTGYGAVRAESSVFIGDEAGQSAIDATESIFLGPWTGYGAVRAESSVFIGDSAGTDSIDAIYSNYIGPSAGYLVNYSYSSNFIGDQAGAYASNAVDSNFIGRYAGHHATNVDNSNFIGNLAGYYATGVSYSNLFGYQAGKFYTGNNIGSNNIIIGTNISLPNATANAINLGGVLFAKNTYATTTGDPSIAATATGSLGIGVIPANISARLHLPAGTATAGTAPLKFTAGTNLTTPEAGAMEWDGTNLFITQTSGPTRKTLAYTSDLASYVPYTGATGNVNLGTYSLISPTILGGSATTADLTLQTTSGVGTTGADMHFKVGSNGGTEAMTILNSGNVGVGTTNPGEKIEVNGNIYINNASGYLKFQNGFKFSNGASDVTVTDSGNNTIMIFDEL